MRMLTMLAVPAVSAAAVLTLAPAASASEPDAVAVVAHRGASAAAPENTLAAFRQGIAMKSDLIETDVQRSKDGVLVLMHDTTLSRTTNVEQVFPDRSPWKVADFTYAEMQRLDAGSWRSPDHAGEPIPTLADAVETIRPSRSGFLIEIKAPSLYPGIEAQVAEELRAFPGYVESAVAADRLAVQSFDFESMRRYDALEPDVPVGLLGTPSRDQLPALAEFAEQVNPWHGSVDASYVADVHAAGMDCLVWTVDAPADMRRAADKGVDGIITNKPDLLAEVLAEDTSQAPAA